MLEVRIFSGDLVRKFYADYVEVESTEVKMYRHDTIVNATVEESVKLKRNERVTVKKI